MSGTLPCPTEFNFLFLPYITQSYYIYLERVGHYHVPVKLNSLFLPYDTQSYYIYLERVGHCHVPLK